MARWCGPLIWVGCIVGVGCGFDRSPLKGREVVGSPVHGGDANGAAGAPGGGGGGSGATLARDAGHGAGGASVMPADAAVVANDAGIARDAGGMHAGSGGSAPSQGTPDAGAHDAGDTGHIRDAGTTIVPGSYPRCTSDYGCGDAQGCDNANPNGPGHCAGRCQQDFDCVDYDGFDFTCDTSNGLCRLDCGSSGSQGKCPDGLRCVGAQNNDDSCRLPAETGSGDRTLYQPCDLAHEDGDCVDGLLCFRASGTHIDSPGYCAMPCSSQQQSDQCMNTTDATATLSCNGSVCRFECSNGTCPAGMECEPLANSNLAGCHYPVP